MGRKPLLSWKSSICGLAFTLPFYATQSLAAEPVCELDRPVAFAGLDWDSNAFHTSIAQFILENGYGCETSVIPGSNIPLLTGWSEGMLMLQWRFGRATCPRCCPTVKKQMKSLTWAPIILIAFRRGLCRNILSKARMRQP